MSFTDSDGDVWACVFLHNGGGDVKGGLDECFRRIAQAAAGATNRQDPGLTRFHDPSYLAARYIVWLVEDNILAQGVGVWRFQACGTCTGSSS